VGGRTGQRTPAALREHLPEVYRQLELFYRQHPL
jgi:Mlc titration factor MtfA (ptsG expression regulator)